MKRFVIIQWHDGGPDEIVSIGENDTHRVIEKLQLERKRNPYIMSDSCSWRYHEGDFVSALIESTKGEAS